MPLVQRYNGVQPSRESRYKCSPTLEYVNFDIEIPDTPIQPNMEWPLNSVVPRTDRLNLMERLYHGIMTDFYKPFMSLPMNYFRLVANTVANEVVAIPPKVEGQSKRFNRSLMNAFRGAAKSIVQNGTCVAMIYQGPNGEYGIDIVQPEFYYPTYSGYKLVVPYTEDGDSDYANKVEVSEYFSEVPNSLFVTNFGFEEGGNIRDVIDEVSEPTNPEALQHFSADLSPWGDRKFEDILPLVLELSVRFSAISHYGNKHAYPDRVITAADDDAARIFSPNLTTAQQVEESRSKLNDLIPDDDDATAGHRWKPNVIQDSEPDTWDGHIGEMQEQIRMIESKIYTLCGLVPLEILGAKGNPAGVTLKRLTGPEYNSTRVIQETIKFHFELMLESVGITDEIQIKHVLDAGSANSDAAQMQAETGDELDGPNA